MKIEFLKILKNLQLLFFCVVLLFLQSCSGPDECEPPSSVYGDLMVEFPMDALNVFSPCKTPFTTNSSNLKNALDANGMNALAKLKSESSSKWVIELIVGGKCSGNGAWAKNFLKGDFTVVTKPSNLGPSGFSLRFTLKNVPTSSNNEITVIPKILGPCDQGSCKAENGQTFSPYRIVWTTVSATLKDPTANKFYNTNNLVQDISAESCN
jgi:hypothetical protein